MKIAILSDIHANIQALESVLDNMRKKDIDHVWFLGDAVGRGPNPIEVLNWLKDNVVSGNWIIGNHEAMLADLLSPQEWERVNELPKIVINEHKAIIREDAACQAFVEENFVEQRKASKVHELDNVCYVLVHGSLKDYLGIRRYIFPWLKRIFLPNEFKQLETFGQSKEIGRVLCLGHTHMPTLVSASKTDEKYNFEDTMIMPGETYALTPGKLWIINPGSVGQPRDLDNRASYGILDTKAHTITFKRVRYPWRDTARKLIRARYPDRLISILREANADKDTPQKWIDHFERARQVDDE